MKKLLTVLFMILVFQVLCITPAYAYDPSEYHQGDVEVINDLIENHGLRDANVNEPENWNERENPDGFVAWSMNNPKRIVQLHINDRDLYGDIDVSTLTEMSELYINKNNISSLTAKNLIGVIPNNQGVFMDCGENPLLNEDNVDFTGSVIGYLYINKTGLTKFDASAQEYKYLKTLYCQDNKLTELNIAGHDYLDTFSCASNLLTELDIRNIPNLLNFKCNDNKIESLDFSTGHSNLSAVEVYNNKLTSLELTGLTNITNLNISGNNISSLDVSGLTKLQYLTIDDNPITELNITGLNELRQVIFNKTNIAELNANNLRNLTYIIGGECKSLTSVSITGCPNLSDVSLSQGAIAEISLANLPALNNLNLDTNKLSAIDLSGVPSVETVNLTKNNLTEIDLSGLSNLKSLELSDNNLTEIDLSDVTNLEILGISNNKVKSIDISPITKLYYAAFENNPVTYLKVSDDKSYTIKDAQEGSINLEGFKRDDVDNKEYIATIKSNLNENFDCWIFESGETSKINPLELKIDSNYVISTDAKILVTASKTKASSIDVVFNLPDSPQNYQYCILEPEKRLILKNLTKTELTGVAVKPGTKVMLFAYRDPSRLIYSTAVKGTQLSGAKAPSASVKSVSSGIGGTTNLIFSKPYPGLEYQLAAAVDTDGVWENCPDSKEAKGVTAAVGSLAFIRTAETGLAPASLATKGFKTLVSPNAPDVTVNLLDPAKPSTKPGIYKDVEIVPGQGINLKTLQYVVASETATVDDLINTKTTKWKAVSKGTIPNVNIPEGQTIYVRVKATSKEGFSEAYKK